LSFRELTVGEGERTPTLKVKRRVIETRFRVEIDEMYSDRTQSGSDPAPRGAKSLPN
jgi:long-subunit acyl-CoA synthetase (AMP-forming)